MKTVIILASLALVSCGSDQETQSEAIDKTAMEAVTENPFVGTFKSDCKYGDLITVVNTETTHDVTIQRYLDRDCSGSYTVDTYSKAYTLRSVQKFSGIYEVDTDRQVAWRHVDQGMVLDISYWDDKAGLLSRSYTMMEVVLVRQ